MNSRTSNRNDSQQRPGRNVAAALQWIGIRSIGTIIVVFGLCVAISAAESYAQRPAVTREYKVKVAYLYNFTRYISWPKSAFCR